MPKHATPLAAAAMLALLIVFPAIVLQPLKWMF